MSVATETVTEMDDVVQFVVDAHRGEVRKLTGIPYICHPMAVLTMLTEWEIPNIVIWKAALCHDILESRPDLSYEDLVPIIGEKAATIVEELTFIPKENSSLSDAEQKQEYLASFMTKSIPALVIKIADRFSNVLDFISTDPDYAPKYYRKAKSLFAAMKQRGEQHEIEEFFDNAAVYTLMKYTGTMVARFGVL